MQDTMGQWDIAFPNLGIYLENVPKSFELFGITIALYGVIIGIAIMAGIMMAEREAKVNGHDPNLIWDFAIYAVIFSVIGARVYFVIFSWDLYKNDLLSIFNTRNGGLAIYGAVIAAFLTLFIYSKVKKKNPFLIGDMCIFGLILGQIIGRWGNFTNREAFGQYTDSLFAMRLPITAVRSNEITVEMADHVVNGINYIQVHPTFLYESVGNLIILILMLLYRKKKKFEGEMCLIYLGGYGILRFFVEGLRTDQLLIPNTNLAVSQLLGFALFVISVTGEVIIRKNIKKKEKEKALEAE
ncbi:MAG: prolipoprotein diacylglyceryl transferase [Lachnospiraceae bacterium]|nr:prolipoprotein diacylglyceryl transferase [Lachnospiraceae bacterium]